MNLVGLIDTFVAVDRLETTALLAVIAELSDDEVLVRRIRRELAGRDHRLPAWLVQLGAVSVAPMRSTRSGRRRTGRGHARTAAAAIAWIVGKAHGLFDSSTSMVMPTKTSAGHRPVADRCEAPAVRPAA